ARCSSTAACTRASGPASAPCAKTYTMSLDYLKHIRSHTGKRPYSCTDCGMAFTQSSCLAHHRCTHTSKQPFVCLHVFVHTATLKQHQQLQSGLLHWHGTSPTPA
ncbi:PREDICTED: zinc finger protein 771-like, partial [Chlamydotis macqueenii]|uniref:zinc finger protein 771-like n=1 Tax=Chlamydotis macqueenii TaxID=187382 RepID=UPI000529BA29